MRAWTTLAVLVAVLTSCQKATVVLVHVDGEASIALVGLRASLGGATTSELAKQSATTLPQSVALHIEPDGNDDVSIVAIGKQGGSIIRCTATALSSAHHRVDFTITLGAGLAGCCASSAPADTSSACGGTCGGCALGAACTSALDCQSGACTNGVCSSTTCLGTACNLPACMNFVKDAGEAGIDCGGSCSLACAGETCSADVACVTGHCESGFCVAATGPPNWSTGPSLKTARASLRCSTLDDGTIYAVGGYTSTAAAVNTVESLAPGGSAWQTAPSLIQPRSVFGLAKSQDALYALSGNDGTDAIGAVEALSSSAGPWTSKTATSVSTALDTATFDDGTILASEEISFFYAPTAGTTTTAPSPHVNRADQALVHGANDLVYGVGGTTYGGGNKPSADVESLARNASAWTTQPALSTARAVPGAAAAPDGRIYAVGGDDYSTGHASAAVEAFLPGTSAWVRTADLPSPRRAPGVCLGVDGRIWVVGGAVDTNTVMNDVVAYGPIVQLSANHASAGGALTVNASNFAASARVAVLFDGAVIASGTTDAVGTAILTLSVASATSSGPHTVQVFDVLSQYPIATTLTVP